MKKRTPKDACGVVEAFCQDVLDRDEPRYGLHQFAREVLGIVTELLDDAALLTSDEFVEAISDPTDDDDDTNTDTED